MDPITIALMAGTALTSLFGSNKQANAAKDATNAQTQASAAELAMQERMYQQTRADNEPWRQAGIGALGQLQARFGGGPAPITTQQPQAPSDIYGGQSIAPSQSAGQRYLAANPDLAQEWARIQGRDERFRTADDYVAWHKANYPGEARPEGADPTMTNGQVSAVQDIYGAEPQAAPSGPASPYAYDPTVAQTGGYEAPSRELYTAPNASLPGFNGTLQQRQEYAPRQEFRALDTSIDAFRASPDYEFRKSEALKGVNAGMSANGSLNSGRRGLALAERASNLADGEYTDWYGRTSGQYNLDRSRADSLYSQDRGRADAIYSEDRGFAANQGNLDRSRGDALYAADRGYAADRYDQNTGDIMAMAGIGRQATAANQGAAAQWADAYGQATQGAAQAQATGAINSANAWTSGINNVMQTGAYLYGQGAFGGAKKPAAGLYDAAGSPNGWS